MGAEHERLRWAYAHDRILEYVCAQPGAAHLVVRRRDTVPNGYSNITEIYDATWNANGEPRERAFVVRGCAPGRELFFDTPLRWQWDMMKAVAEHSDVPVPELFDFHEGDIETGGDLFLMAAVSGRVPRNGTPSYHAEGWVFDLDPAERERLATNAIEQLVRIHSIDWAQHLPFLNRPERGRDGLDQFLTYQEDWYVWAAGGRTFPEVERGLAWLRAHQPQKTRTCVTWGDARVGNMIFADDLSVAAVLDWEMAALGCPEMDVAWWWLFEELFTAGTTPLKGIPDRRRLIDEYQEASGHQLGDLHYYDVLAWVRMIITCIRMMCPEPDDDVSPLEIPFQRRLRELLVTRP